MNTSRACIRSLADYNAGHDKWKWFDLEDYASYEDFLEAVHDWLQELSEEADDDLLREEWEVCGWENCGGLVSQYGVDPELWVWLEVADKTGWDWEIIEAATELGKSPHNAEWDYYGEYDSLSDLARELYEGTGMLANVPAIITCHIDWDSVARDLFISDFDYAKSSRGTYYVFAVH